MKILRHFTVLPSFFDAKKQRPKTDLDKSYQCTVSIKISLVLKVCFSIVTSKIMIKFTLFNESDH